MALTDAQVTALDSMCPVASNISSIGTGLGTLLQSVTQQLGIYTSDTTIAIGDGVDTIAVGVSSATGTPTITINGDTDACTVNIATVANHTTNIGTGSGVTNIGGTSSGAVNVLSDGIITIGHTTATTSITMIAAGAVDIGKAGQATTIKGTLNVDQAASFDTTVQIGTTTTAALALGGGTSTTKLTNAVTGGKNFGGFWTENTATDGSDYRGLYWRHYLSATGGSQSGEAIRAYCTVEDSAANAARGIHSSLDFGTSGDISGLGAALDATLHVPNGNLGGTVAAISADINGDGASSDITGTGSFIRCSLQGTTTNLQDVYFLNVEGTGSAAAYDSGEMYVLSNSGTITEAFKVKTPAGDRWVPLLSATVAP